MCYIYSSGICSYSWNPVQLFKVPKEVHSVCYLFILLLVVWRSFCILRSYSFQICTCLIFFNKMLDLLLGFSQLIKQPSCHIVEGIVLLPPGLESHVLPATPCLGSILHEPNHVRSSQNCKMQSGRVRCFRLPADEPKHDSPTGRPETAGEVLNDERCWAGAAAGSLHTFWSGAWTILASGNSETAVRQSRCYACMPLAVEHRVCCMMVYGQLAILLI